MDKKQALGVIGAIVLGLGAFCPIVSTPRLTFFDQGRGDGMILVALASGALLVSLLRRPVTLLASAICAAGLVGFDFYRFWGRVVAAQAELAASADPARAIPPELSWGWLVMAAGLVLLFAACLVKDPAWRT